MKINKDTVALVTGASRGLGYATAIALAGQGAHIIALARTVGGLEELADEVDAAGGSITLVPLDITDDQGLERMCLSIFERWGRLDLLVHCAAHAAPLSPVPQVAEKDFDRCMQVNARATQRIITLCAPLLKNGTAIFIDDNHDGEKFFSAYAASKAAARQIVSSWALETANLATNIVQFRPNPMPTAIRARFFPGENVTKHVLATDEANRLINHLNQL